MLDALNKIDLNSKKIGLHSLRAGGATATANLGVSERVKNGYVYKNIQENTVGGSV